jgi:oligopeptide/dipeptide ABC transporter ATP-binding protein
MTALVEVDGVSVRFPLRKRGETVKALSEISLRLEPGVALGVIGESGSGKTTLGRCIAGLVGPTAGAVRLGTGEAGSRARVQMLFQDPGSSLDPRLTVGASIEEVRRLTPGAPRSSDLAAEVGLDARVLESRPSRLTPSEQQRVALARALAGRPDLIVLDEPVTALDLVARADILAMLDRIRRERNIALLYISHDLATVRYLCDQVLVMYLGRVVERGPAAALLGAPLHPYSLALLSSSLDPDPRRRANPYTLSGEIPSAVNPPPGCALHPRCPRATEECGTTPPAVDRESVALCWHPLDGATRAEHLIGAGA